MRIGVIGGTGVYDPAMMTGVSDVTVETAYGSVSAKLGTLSGKEVVFLPRHGSEHSIPPHRINYRANIMAMKLLEVEKILATSAVGSLHQDMKPGHCVILDQFIDMTKGRCQTFYDGGQEGVVHTDFTEPYCPELRAILYNTAKELCIPTHPKGTYVCTEGPRFETPAEIKMFQYFGGHLVGMTNLPEVVLAREAGICYGVVALVTNFAAGISTQPLTHEEVVEVMQENNENIKKILMTSIDRIGAGGNCRCGLSQKPMKGTSK